MRCREVRAQLPDLVRAALSTELQSAIAAHLETCGRCRLEEGEIRGILGRLEGYTQRSASAPPSAAYWAGVVPRIHARLNTPRVFAFPDWIQRFALPLAGATALVIVLLTLVPRGSGRDAPDTSAGFQTALGQLNPEDLQEQLQQQVIAGLVDPAPRELDNAVTSEEDTELLGELLAADGDDRSASAGIDHEILLQDLGEEETDHLVSILDQSGTGESTLQKGYR